MDAASAIKELLALAQRANVAALARRRVSRAGKRKAVKLAISSESDDHLSLH
jgi:hypothetical protein